MDAAKPFKSDGLLILMFGFFKKKQKNILDSVAI